MVKLQTTEVYQGKLITEEGLRMNISVGIQYTHLWLSDRGENPFITQWEDAQQLKIPRYVAGTDSPRRWETKWMVVILRRINGRIVSQNSVQKERLVRKPLRKGDSKRRQRCLQISFEMMNSYHF